MHHTVHVAAAFATDQGARNALGLLRSAGLKPTEATIRSAVDAHGNVSMATLELDIPSADAPRFSTLVAGAHGIVVPGESRLTTLETVA